MKTKMCNEIIYNEEKETTEENGYFVPYEIEYSNRLKKLHIKKQRQAYEEAEMEDMEDEFV